MSLPAPFNVSEVTEGEVQGAERSAQKGEAFVVSDRPFCWGFGWMDVLMAKVWLEPPGDESWEKGNGSLGGSPEDVDVEGVVVAM